MTEDERQAIYNLAWRVAPTISYEEARRIVDAIEPAVRKDERKELKGLGQAILRDYRISLRERLIDTKAITEESIKKKSNDLEFLIGNITIVVLDSLITLIEADMKGGKSDGNKTEGTSVS